jgi:hypothetical protein
MDLQYSAMTYKPFRAIIGFCLTLLIAGCPQNDIGELSSDALNGRAPRSHGSVEAQKWLVAKLTEINAVALTPGYKQSYSGGTNIIGMIRGTTRPNEYIILGAHYDHLGNNCYSSVGSDNICNGSGDNAAGVASVLEVVESITRDNIKLSRSIVVAFWDGEEQGLFGSAAYTRNPLVPLNQTKAYINFDILGSNLLPSLANNTFILGTETGGSLLRQHVNIASQESGMDVTQLSIQFAQHRSDHQNFINKKIPSVFFTDAPGSCYHTAQDDEHSLDYRKLDREIGTARRLLLRIANENRAMAFVAPGNIPYSDSLHLSNFSKKTLNDFHLFNGSQRTKLQQYHNQLKSIYNAGSGSYNSSKAATMANAAKGILQQIAQLPCNAFIPS